MPARSARVSDDVWMYVCILLYNGELDSVCQLVAMTNEWRGKHLILFFFFHFSFFSCFELDVCQLTDKEKRRKMPKEGDLGMYKKTNQREDYLTSDVGRSGGRWEGVGEREILLILKPTGGIYGP